MKSFSLSVLTMAMAIAVCVSGCNKGSEDTPAGGNNSGNTAGGAGAGKTPAGDKVIGFSVLTMENPFFKDLAEDVATAAKRHGYSVIVVDSEEKEANQDNQVRDFITRKVNAIILNPANSSSIGESIKRANRAGIPVFTCDIKSLSPDAKVVCHVATNNYTGGRLAAQAIMEVTGNVGKVAIVDYPEIESVMERVRGFKDELREKKSPIEIVQIVPAEGKREKAFSATKEIMTNAPDLSAIFAINDPTGLGVAAALKSLGKTDQVKIVAFDGMPEGKRAIKDGRIYADAVQSTKKIAEGVVNAIVKDSEGEDVPAEIRIPTTLYRKADADADPTLKDYKPGATE